MNASLNRLAAVLAFLLGAFSIVAGRQAAAG